MQSEPTPTAIVWANISQLLGVEDATLQAVQGKTKLGRGNLQRIRAGGNVVVDSVAQLASDFRVPLWRLFVPLEQAGDAPASHAAEPLKTYAIKSDSQLLDATSELLARVPEPMRAAFADILAGWALAGGTGDRRSALEALLQVSPTKLQKRA